MTLPPLFVRPMPFQSRFKIILGAVDVMDGPVWAGPPELGPEARAGRCLVEKCGERSRLERSPMYSIVAVVCLPGCCEQSHHESIRPVSTQTLRSILAGRRAALLLDLLAAQTTSKPVTRVASPISGMTNARSTHATSTTTIKDCHPIGTSSTNRVLLYPKINRLAYAPRTLRHPLSILIVRPTIPPAALFYQSTLSFFKGLHYAMTRTPPAVLRKYLFGGQISRTGYSADPAPTIPFRKQLKDAAKKRKSEGAAKTSREDNQKLEEWELTVGIEIHAQLNTARKLFSTAASSINDVPNTHVALFDLAMPGSQPIFQKETLIPAIRAALALNCKVQKTSKFDRKHYFHWDQPSGYQITQYYEPFAKDGYITLYAHDGIAKEDGDEIQIGIKQVQMEQDTAKTISQPGEIHLLDFNRVGLPLIEIITLPQIHYPSTAAAFVRKVQILLNSVDACVLGMQSGGLRADVNVSVRRRAEQGTGAEYAGVKGLGQRTEIKNLSSFKAVEDAIIAERDRQIQILEAGGAIEGETRGWTIGSTETRRLRGKEGEVDYRYMPDADLGPVIIGDDLLTYLEKTLGVLPDEEIKLLVEVYGLTTKDALSMVSLNEGGRAEYFRNVVDHLLELDDRRDLKTAGKLAGNWVLHELGGLASDAAEEENALQMTSEGDCIINHRRLGDLIDRLDNNQITGTSAKKILTMLFEMSTDEQKTVKQLIDEEGLWFNPLSAAEYDELAKSILDMKIVEEILAGKEGKINFLLGKMMRADGEGRVDAKEATAVLRRIIEEHRR
ncbi:Glutamyl-tRNA(Gln) amidotransferase subunit [Hyphodiscus hymeniophilus]|uniref:Glutamyl-tRNA(Gln) amidotransferase subunit B, mitochondrial n=1 Tax=Hyphodiscus hymeniophilus TaxID=353542 RepID=A0A9P6VFY3_9HELO|nr:Glutamyl-tRNA(Gln) amidotransferase subunit [Hyphodiscus hymeniophilus]